MLNNLRDRWIEFVITYILIFAVVFCACGKDVKMGIIWAIIIASVNGLILLYRIKNDI